LNTLTHFLFPSFHFIQVLRIFCCFSLYSLYTFRWCSIVLRYHTQNLHTQILYYLLPHIMVNVIILLIIFNLFPVVYPLFDKPISVSCSTNFDPSNWTHYAFIIQTLIMIIIVCFGIYHMYKRFRLRRRSPHHTSHTNPTSFNTREFHHHMVKLL